MKVFILTLGCPKNQVDSEKLAGALLNTGHEVVDDPREADLILVNTCAFIRDAEEESREYIEKLSEMAPVGIIGCLPARRPGLPRLGRGAPEGALKVIRLADEIFSDPEKSHRFSEPTPYAYIKIAEGCSRRCSFCVIPKIRGRLRSRRISRIEREARGLLRAGKRELVLVAQDTSQFGWDTGQKLEDLLVALDRIGGEFWLRVMYLHPGGVSAGLMRTMASLDHMVPYLHIPVQHLSGPVLRAMGRAGGAEAVRRVLALRERYMPDAFIRTEVMVGFPGESREDFHTLLEGITSGAFQRVAVFRFRKEEGSRAFALEDLDPGVVSERYEVALALADALHARVQGALVGQGLELLVDEPGLARTRFDAPEVDFSVRVPRQWAQGNFQRAVIQEATPEGDLVARVPRRE